MGIFLRPADAPHPGQDFFLQVMWRYLEQASFPLSEADYLAHLNQIATYLNGWGQTAYVQQWIDQTREKPRLGKAVSIPLDLGERAPGVVGR